MERLTRMSLKKALFTIALFHIAAALLLSLLLFWGCLELSSVIAPQGVLIDVHSAPLSMIKLPDPTKEALLMANILSVLQIVLPLLICTMALLSTASMFYRVKLKQPLATLADGASRMIEHDLDFTMEVPSPDELGQLCKAFETMRRTLLANNQELWRQAEERKRLNAAFAHNLRNPVTVLKGSAKLMRKGIAGHTMDREQLEEQLALLENYTDRIERYIETMSSVQRLEEIPLTKESVAWELLVLKLQQAISLIGTDTKLDIPVDISFEFFPSPKTLSLDSSVLFQIAENLVSNALRFAKKKICISCSAADGLLTLSVADDGCGFPSALLKGGIQPFQKGNEDGEHFGMGLYSSMLLARKHGGNVEICNGPTGAVVTATLDIR